MINNYSVLNNFHIMLSMMIYIHNKDGKASKSAIENAIRKIHPIISIYYKTISSLYA